MEADIRDRRALGFAGGQIGGPKLMDGRTGIGLPDDAVGRQNPAHEAIDLRQSCCQDGLTQLRHGSIRPHASVPGERNHVCGTIHATPVDVLSSEVP